MSRLTPLQKQFVVQSLAHFSSLSEVCDQLKEQFGVTASTAQIARYKPGTIAGAGLCKPLNDFFYASRDKFLSDYSTIPMFHLAHRLRKLGRMIDQTFENNPRIALRALEQAARESGGMFTSAHAWKSAMQENSLHTESTRQINLALSAKRTAEAKLADYLSRQVEPAKLVLATSNNEAERAAPRVPERPKLRIA